MAAEIAADDAKLAEIEGHVKALQRDATQLKASRAALAALADELKASGSATGQARNKAITERAAAAEVASHAPEVAGRLAADHVRAIDAAVATVEAKAEEGRTATAQLARGLAWASAAEANAKTASTNAKASLAEAKKDLADHAKAIDAQTARVKSLKDQAADAAAKNQDSLTYLLMVDLKAALALLDSLVDPARGSAMRAAVQSAWEDVLTMNKAEEEATRASQQQARALKEAQDALVAREKNRKKDLEALVGAAGAGPSPLIASPTAPPAG